MMDIMNNACICIMHMINDSYDTFIHDEYTNALHRQCLVYTMKDSFDEYNE